MSSNSSPSIVVQSVSKCYRVFDRPQDRLLQGLWMGRKRFYREFWALSDIDFTVAKGETVGIVGRNGSGKSTLLQIISGTLAPTTGQVAITGRVSGLLELGAGFNPEFTGRENVFLSAALLGLSAVETEDRYESICAFADIGDFINQPIKFYSSGMLVRLGFAVQTVLEPSVLVVDEALAVGDARFQKKCYDYLEGFRRRGGTILFVTHDTGITVQICDKAIILDGGKMFSQGEPHKIAKEYHRLLFGGTGSISLESGEVSFDKGSDTEIGSSAESGDSLKTEIDAPTNTDDSRELRYGSQKVVVNRVGIRDSNGESVNVVETCQEVSIFLEAEYCSDVPDDIAYGFIITNVKGLEVYGTKSGLHSMYLPPGEKGQRFVCAASFEVLLVPGNYFITAALAPRNSARDDEFYDVRFDAFEFKIIGEVSCFTTSVVDLQARLSHQTIA
jgi:lipopolysaccharide transport system ATP-binding protein